MTYSIDDLGTKELAEAALAALTELDWGWYKPMEEVQSDKVYLSHEMRDALEFYLDNAKDRK